MEGCDAPRRKTIDVEELPISMSILGIKYGDDYDDDDKDDDDDYDDSDDDDDDYYEELPISMSI